MEAKGNSFTEQHSELAIKVKELSIENSKRKLLDSVNLDLKKGDFLAIFGRSGSGKSTLIKALLGIPFPSNWKSSGSIYYFGRENISPKLVQPVFQDPIGSFDPLWSLEKSLREPLLLLKEEDQYEVLLDKWIPILGLLGRDLKRNASSFSGGELQRFALLRALLVRPKIFLLDEATSALDPILRNDVVSELSKLSRNAGASILWVTHNVRTALTYCSRIAVMESGSLIEEGTVSEVSENPRKKETKLLMEALSSSGKISL
ncbi:ABC transporter ATP-binding protein [Leptospira perolatii]|uniref:ABC transporter ATP-binding protein n=1 Tax=Leptospira perolatii TaxID=2023191 RepID=A0A2M9ZMA1_9LEPT|nr:ATP-binding cassette domain-containing protein [Leptospira perolatii]PJZ69111.1 ABC transporter ATP-binding protein [Leptospira perolatii]PJZ73145.1 ABC transporter ATP-binding protein [Leptospira perolatii]